MKRQVTILAIGLVALIAAPPRLPSRRRTTRCLTRMRSMRFT